MMYKTIVLQLLQDRPEMHEQLRKKRKLLATVELCGQELKRMHEAWKDVLSQARPGSDPSQIASEALELALEDLVNCLDSESPPDENEPMSLDGAMAFIRRRRHTPPE
jgi:hypothetical protein